MTIRISRPKVGQKIIIKPFLSRRACCPRTLATTLDLKLVPSRWLRLHQWRGGSLLSFDYGYGFQFDTLL